MIDKRDSRRWSLKSRYIVLVEMVGAEETGRAGSDGHWRIQTYLGEDEGIRRNGNFELNGGIWKTVRGWGVKKEIEVPPYGRRHRETSQPRSTTSEVTYLRFI